MSVEIDGTETVLRALQKISDNIPNLLSGLGTIIEEQTKRRISDEKTAPDGTPWDEWSDKYRKTRGSENSLLIGEGHLLDSIQHQLSDKGTLLVGTNMVYAATQQFGRGGIPAREFLGFSDENLGEIETELKDWAEQLF